RASVLGSDVAGRSGGGRRAPADLGRKHFERGSRLAAARRLDPGVEAQHVRLLGDLGKLRGNSSDLVERFEKAVQLAVEVGDVGDQPRDLDERLFGYAMADLYHQLRGFGRL